MHIQAEKPKDMVMHWAVNDWNLSPESCRPEGTQQIDDKAVQTPFKDGKSIHLSFPEADAPSRYRRAAYCIEKRLVSIKLRTWSKEVMLS